MLYLCGECVCTCWVHLKKIQGNILYPYFQWVLKDASANNCATHQVLRRPGLACCDCGKSWTWRTFTFFVWHEAEALHVSRRICGHMNGVFGLTFPLGLNLQTILSSHSLLGWPKQRLCMPSVMLPCRVWSGAQREWAMSGKEFPCLMDSEVKEKVATCCHSDLWPLATRKAGDIPNLERFHENPWNQTNYPPDYWWYLDIPI